MSLSSAYAATLTPQTFVQPEGCGAVNHCQLGLLGHLKPSAAAVYNFQCTGRSRPSSQPANPKCQHHTDTSFELHENVRESAASTDTSLGTRLLIQWLIHCRYPPRSIRQPVPGHCSPTHTGGPDRRSEQGKQPSFPLSNNKSKRGDTGRPDQLPSADLASQAGPRLAGHYLFSTCLMSDCVIALLVEDRCCTHIHAPLCS